MPRIAALQQMEVCEDPCLCAETYTPKQLRLASPLRAENVSVRRLPELKIDHPAYMLGTGTGDMKLVESPEIRNSNDQLPRGFLRAQSAAMNIPLNKNSASTISNIDSSTVTTASIGSVGNHNGASGYSIENETSRQKIAVSVSLAHRLVYYV